jgi:hypothetical protein
MPEPRPLPEGARLLHIGPPKTGSTALQDALHQSRVSLGRQGVTYVSRVRHELIPARYITGKLPGGPKWAWAEQRWNELVDAMRAQGPERKIYSSEYLSDATDEQVVRIVDALGPEDTYVVITLRPLVDIVPSQYQQYLQGGLTADYESWLQSTFVDEPFTGPTPWFWQRHRHDALVERWARVLGHDRVIVVVTDGRDFDAVPAVFEKLLGLTRGTLVGRKVRPNRSLTWPEAEVMRRFNVEAQSMGLVDSKYQMVTKIAADHVKERTPRSDESRIVTPGWAARAADELGAEFAAAIAGLGVLVVGDVDVLHPGTGGNVVGLPPETVDVDIAARFAAGFVLAERQVRKEAAARRGARRRGKPQAPEGKVGGGRAAKARRKAEHLVARVRDSASSLPPIPGSPSGALTGQRSAASVIE